MPGWWVRRCWRRSAHRNSLSAHELWRCSSARQTPARWSENDRLRQSDAAPGAHGCSLVSFSWSIPRQVRVWRTSMRTAEVGCVAVLALGAGGGADGQPQALANGAGGLQRNGRMRRSTGCRYGARAYQPGTTNYAGTGMRSSTSSSNIDPGLGELQPCRASRRLRSSPGRAAGLTLTLGSTIRFTLAFAFRWRIIAAGTWNHPSATAARATCSSPRAGWSVGLVDGTSSSNRCSSGSGTIGPGLPNRVMDEVATEPR